MSPHSPDYRKHLLLFVDDEKRTREYFRKLFGKIIRMLEAEIPVNERKAKDADVAAREHRKQERDDRKSGRPTQAGVRADAAKRRAEKLRKRNDKIRGALIPEFRQKFEVNRNALRIAEKDLENALEAIRKANAELVGWQE